MPPKAANHSAYASLDSRGGRNASLEREVVSNHLALFQQL